MDSNEGGFWVPIVLTYFYMENEPKDAPLFSLSVYILIGKFEPSLSQPFS